MKLRPNDVLLHKEVVEKILKPWLSLKHTEKPVLGWIKSIRVALGITTKQLAERMGIAQPNVMAIEDREILKSISLDTLEKAARAMDCQLVYAIIPNVDLITNKAAPKLTSSPVIRQQPTIETEADDDLSLLQRYLRNPK